MTGRRRWLLAFAILVGIGTAYVFREPILVAAGSYLIADEPRRTADTIVVLSGSTPDRILEAVDIYRDGYAPLLVLTRGSSAPGIEELRARGGEMAEPHEVNRSIAVQLGVPAAAIRIVEGGAGGTVTEAQVVIDDLRRMQVKSALIVTSKLHTRRAGWIYRGMAGDEIDFTTCASTYDPYRPDRWWRSRGHTRRVVIEYEKLLVYLLRDSWR